MEKAMAAPHNGIQEDGENQCQDTSQVECHSDQCWGFLLAAVAHLAPTPTPVFCPLSTVHGLSSTLWLYL